MPGSNTIDTRNLLYHYLQRDLHRRDPELFRVLTSQLVPRMAIWLSPDIYARLPLLVPYARRDPQARGDATNGIPDSWGAPDSSGYFRDDNSLVKGVPRSLVVRSSFPRYASRRLGAGFTASHLWRSFGAPGWASRHPLTYSFVPNLVWLPSQVAGLSDLEDSLVQRLLQRISMMIYRDVEVLPGHRELVKSIWELLPAPESDSDLPPLPDPNLLSFFEPGGAFVARRRAMIARVAQALSSGSAPGKIISTRYGKGIPAVPAEARVKLGSFLSGYAAAITD